MCLYRLKCSINRNIIFLYQLSTYNNQVAINTEKSENLFILGHNIIFIVHIFS